MRRWSATLALGFLASLLAPSAPVMAGPLDGQIVYSDGYGRSGIYSSSPDGTGRVHLVKDVAYGPEWFPDRSGISYLRLGARGNGRLEAIDVDGSNHRVLIGRGQLPDPYRSVYTYAWSPDGSHLVLNLTTERFHHALFVSNPDGTSLVKIAAGASVPDWSSGDRIVAIRDDRLITLDPDGGNVIRLGVGHGFDPSWSPDGTMIAFMCGHISSADICVVNDDGSGLVNVTNSARGDWSPSWSPDGTRIIWAPVTEPRTGYADLFRMKADGTATTRLTHTPRIDEYEPEWTVLP